MKVRVALVLCTLGALLMASHLIPSASQADILRGTLATPGECGTRLSPQAIQEFRTQMRLGPQQVPLLPVPPYCIPIAAHIVRKSDGTGGMPVSQLDQALADCNAAYSGTGLTFYQVGGIDYIDSDAYYFNIDTAAEIDALKGINPVANAINCYFTPNLCDESGCWCGMSSFTPDAVQGIAFANDCVGLPSNPSTFPHEVGHYFDLFHTHETAFGAELVDGTNCMTAGDLLCDTPADPGLSGTTVDDNCVYTGSATDGNGDPYDPDTHQYMSYSRKLCRDVFSPQSETKVVATLLAFRPNLIRCPPIAVAGSDQVVQCASHTTTAVSLDGTGSSQPQGHALDFSWSAAGVTWDDATSPTPTGQFPKGVTLVTLTVTDPSLSLTDTATLEVTVEDTLPPSIVCPADIVVECLGSGGNPSSSPAIAAFLAGASASDVCDASLTIGNNAPAFFSTGTTFVTFSTADDAGNPSSCVARVSVVDTTPPSVACPADIVVECSAHGGTPKSDPQLTAFFAAFSATDICDASLVLSNDAPDLFPKGATLVTFTATDDAGNDGVCAATVTVVDTTPPVIAVVLDRDSLWPPNHRMAPIAASVTVTDICDPNPTFVLTSITSDEPDNGLGDGDRPNDIQEALYGSPDTAFLLRSERQGGGDGRVYTILYTAADDAGNHTPAAVTVTVPHDQAGKAYAGAGIDPILKGFLPGETEYSVVLLASAEGHVPVVDPTSVMVGNHFGVIRPIEYGWSDVNGDRNEDLTLIYTTASTLALLALRDSDGVCRAGLHFRDATGTTFWVDDVLALPTPPGDTASLKTDSAAADLYRVRPNPFTGATSMRYAVTAKPGSAVEIGVYNVTGQRMRRLVACFQSAGIYEISWDGKTDEGVSLPAGVYFLHASVAGRQTVRQVILLK